MAKPEWMDGGARQKEMAERLKREVKENARRRGDRAGGMDYAPADRRASVTGSEATTVGSRDLGAASLVCDVLKATRDIRTAPDAMEPCPSSGASSPVRLQRGADCTLATTRETREDIAFGRSDTVLIMFYLEHLLPFLYPFYRPSVLQGGRAWILEMMISSPVVRQATLCQSSYSFSLARGTDSRDAIWQTVLTQTGDAFVVLRKSLQVISGSNIAEHLHGAVRILTSIMQLQRFEITVLGIDNFQAHLSAALALFIQLLNSPRNLELAGPRESFGAVMDHLRPASSVQHAQLPIPSAEQAAFLFSSTLLIFDDIIASTVLQEQPRLYEYHHSLLGTNVDGTDPPINLEAVVGCQNWALLQISEIAVLDAWKQQSKRAGTLNVMELVHRATAIKDVLEAHLAGLEIDPAIIPREGNNSLLDVLTADYHHSQQYKEPTSQSTLVTRVWAHAALVYLFVVVSGWQPASADVRYHVARIIELLSGGTLSPALLRTMIWPFCVAACLAEPSQEACLRCMVEALQPPSVFGRVHKGLAIAESVWSCRDVLGDSEGRDLAMCFRNQGDLVLLV
ncbi:hypothetical protein VMCG_09490 [Cytospora schulzeri]|uniref:Uncharacterized protein n=1 Tax=Cytospora schulzeri TaxID=448051 RepID=A0A423VFZ0_9PEZI|nr:hypothetical protein VMCG_09490 [Valsa malicola]